jgi:hypothetical protein
MIRQNASDYAWDRTQRPVAVWASSDSPEVYCRAHGMSDWAPYRDSLLAIAQSTVGGLGRCDEAEVGRFIDEVLRSVSSTDRPVLLLTHAQNLRAAWPGLNNSAMKPDVLLLGTVEESIGRYPGLRHVRLRGETGGETPHGYGVHADGVGLPSGLWRYPTSNRVFFSVSTKPASAKRHGSPMGSRLDTRITRRGDSVIERAPSWNPQLVEVTVAAMQDGDDPVTWAATAHSLRRSSEVYEGDLLLSLPLHLARLTSEYALPDTEEDAPEDELDSDGIEPSRD